MPMLLRRVFPQKLFQPLGDNMAAVGDHELGNQLLFFLLWGSVQDGVEILDRQSRYDTVADVLGEPSEMFV